MAWGVGPVVGMIETQSGQAMKSLIIGLILIALAAAGPAISSRQRFVQRPDGVARRLSTSAVPVHEARPAPAPPFVADDADGRSHSLDDLCRDGPAVLVFVQDGCPCSERVQVTVNSLHEIYGGERGSR